MQPFAYHRPTTLAEAVALQQADPHGSRYLAGGTDLHLALQQVGAGVATVIDLKDIPALRGILPSDSGGLRIGACTLMAEIEAHAGLQTGWPALVAAAGVVGGPPIRNRATLGGNLCNASPAADTATPLLAYGARAVVAGAKGERSLPLSDLWLGPRQTALRSGEVLAAIDLPSNPPRCGSNFQRLTRTAMDIALVNVATALALDSAGNLAQFSLALGAVAPVVLAVPGLERFIGAALDESLLEEVRGWAESTAQPITDGRASADYRRDMVGVLTQRAVRQAAAMAEQRS